MRQKYFKTPFGSAGAITPPIPDAADPSGFVSYSAGFTFDYQRNLTSDPAAKSPTYININAIYNDITTSLQALQQQGVPEFITSANNGGTAFSYRAGAIVSYSASGNPPFATYVNTVDNNTALPTAANSGWHPVDLLSNANAWAQTQTFVSGATVAGLDAGGANFRAIIGSYGVMLRTDGTSANLLQTAANNQFGSFNGFRPFGWTLATGAVSIDGTGVGTTFGGSAIINGILAVASSITAAFYSTAASILSFVGGPSGIVFANHANTIGNMSILDNGDVAVRGTLTAANGTSGNQVVNASQFIFSVPAVNSTSLVLPGGVTDQVFVGSVTVTNGTFTTNVPLPTAFPTSCVDAVCSFGGNTPPAGTGLSVQPADRFSVNVTTNGISGLGTLGVVIRARGF